MRDLTLSQIERLRLRADEAEVAFEMDEEAFRAFYDRTARSLWAYLSRVTRDVQLADDLLQEAYYRFLRARRAHQSDAHRRNYLYRIATNLVRDGYRRDRHVQLIAFADDGDGPATHDADAAVRAERRTDLQRAMAHLKPRERALLWLAYAQGSSHREIAESLGLKPSSVKMLLFRARGKLAVLLRGAAAKGGEP
jgi:RNA polymerase sigma-70 factor (ECF subfamily)